MRNVESEGHKMLMRRNVRFIVIFKFYQCFLLYRYNLKICNKYFSFLEFIKIIARHLIRRLLKENNTIKSTKILRITYFFFIYVIPFFRNNLILYFFNNANVSPNRNGYKKSLKSADVFEKRSSTIFSNMNMY